MKKIISAKEQFDNDVKNAKYADEVCNYNYYYEEDDEKAVFYFANDSETDYCRSIVPKFQDVKSQYGLILASHFAENEINSWKELQWLSNMSVEELCDNQKMFTTYCDFLFQNCGDIAIEGHCYKDKEIEAKDTKVIGAECTDVNAISSMVEFLRSQLIDKIEAAFECMERDEIEIIWSYNGQITGHNTDDYNIYICKHDGNVMLRFGYICDCNDSFYEKLSSCSVDDLLVIYSKHLHK